MAKTRKPRTCHICEVTYVVQSLADMCCPEWKIEGLDDD